MARYAIGELARCSGVTVRTLHHYDRIGLLTPSERSPAGHRRYTADDTARLRRILFYRELGFALPAIRAVLTGAPVGEHLRRQHRLLRHRLRRTEALLAAVDQEIHDRRLGVELTPEDQLAIFGTDRFTDLFTGTAPAEAQRRGVTYTAQDWAEIQAEAAATIDAFADAIRSGEPAGSERAMRAAEAHRAHLERWFHPCPPDRHRDVAAGYLTSAGDAAWEEIAPGYPGYVADAILANADRLDNRSVAAPRPGRIVLLNGASSSGKTGIAGCLLELLDPPHFHMAVDAIGAMRAVEKTRGLAPDELAAVLRRTRAGFHRAVAAMAAAGNDVVVDHVLSEAWRLQDCLGLFAPFDVTLVAVCCPLPELVRRERARGDRTPGTAAAQYEVVHAHGDHDIEVDTGEHTAEACARRIVTELAGLPAEKAFDRLRRRGTPAVP